MESVLLVRQVMTKLSKERVLSEDDAGFTWGG